MRRCIVTLNIVLAIVTAIVALLLFYGLISFRLSEGIYGFAFAGFLCASVAIAATANAVAILTPALGKRQREYVVVSNALSVIVHIRLAHYVVVGSYEDTPLNDMLGMGVVVAIWLPFLITATGCIIALYPQLYRIFPEPTFKSERFGRVLGLLNLATACLAGFAAITLIPLSRSYPYGLGLWPNIVWAFLIGTIVVAALLNAILLLRPVVIYRFRNVLIGTNLVSAIATLPLGLVGIGTALTGTEGIRAWMAAAFAPALGVMLAGFHLVLRKFDRWHEDASRNEVSRSTIGMNYAKSFSENRTWVILVFLR